GSVQRVGGPSRYTLGLEVGEEVGETKPGRKLSELPDEEVSEAAGAAAELDQVWHVGLIGSIVAVRVGLGEHLAPGGAEELQHEARIRMGDSRVARDAVRHRRAAPDARGLKRI